jgi:hypothetical protein
MRKSLFDVKHIKDEANTVFQYVFLLFETRFEIIKLFLGKKFPEKCASFTESVHFYNRPDSYYIIERYNEIVKEH